MTTNVLRAFVALGWAVRRHTFLWVLWLAYGLALATSEEMRGAREFYVFFTHYVAEMVELV